MTYEELHHICILISLVGEKKKTAGELLPVKHAEVHRGLGCELGLG